MPKLETITIHPTDLQNILQMLHSKQHSGGIVIIDAIYTYTIRDLNGATIADVTKSQQPEPAKY